MSDHKPAENRVREMMKTMPGESAGVVKITPATPFRIQFTSDVVKPKALPPFPYIATKVDFDGVVYTARVMASDLDAAVRTIRAYWPMAEPFEAQEGVNSLSDGDTIYTARQFGSVEAQPKRKWYNFFHR